MTSTCKRGTGARNKTSATTDIRVLQTDGAQHTQASTSYALTSKDTFTRHPYCCNPWVWIMTIVWKSQKLVTTHDLIKQHDLVHQGDIEHLLLQQGLRYCTTQMHSKQVATILHRGRYTVVDHTLPRWPTTANPFWWNEVQTTDHLSCPPENCARVSVLPPKHEWHAYVICNPPKDHDTSADSALIHRVIGTIQDHQLTFTAYNKIWITCRRGERPGGHI